MKFLKVLFGAVLAVDTWNARSQSAVGVDRTEGAVLTLNEPLGRDWPAEWVELPVRLPEGMFLPEQLWLVPDDDRHIEHAFSIRQQYADGSVRDAVVHVYTDLLANRSRTFHVLQRPPGAEHHFIDVSQGNAHGGLKEITVVSDRLVVGAWIGEKTFDPPADGRNLPGPLRGIRSPDAPGWQLQTEWVDLPPVRRVEFRMDQPAVHRVNLYARYGLDDGTEYLFRSGVIVHEPAVVVEEDFVGLSRGGLRLDFARGLKPTMGHGRGRLHPPGAGSVFAGYPIDFTKSWIGRIQPYYAWWNDYGLWWAAYCPGGDYIGILPLNPPRWTNPPPNPIQIHTGPAEQVEALLPFQNGTRKWALIVAPADEAMKRSPGGASLMQRMAIRLGQNPLDKVKDIVLTWPGMNQIRHPHLLCTETDIPGIREKARTDPLFKRVLEQFPDAPNDPAGLYLATGHEQHARQAMDQVASQLHDWVEEALDGSNYGEGLNAIGFTRPLRRAALVFDLAAGSPSVTGDERRRCLRLFAFLADCLADENRWPARHQGFHRGNVNFHSDDYTARAAVVSLLTGHPRQREWMDDVEREMRLEFESSVFPGGVWCEAPNYQAYTMHYLIIAMRIMQLNGFADFSTEPRFRASMDYLFRIQTPFDPRAGHHLLPSVGDTTSYYHSQSLQNVFAWAATLFRDDPKLAGRMMHAWRRGGSIVFGAHGLNHGAGWVQPLTLIDPGIRSLAPAEPLQSERLFGYGALFRNNYGTDRESYFLFKMGQADQHYDSDEGSFHWYALGSPVSLDFGSMYRPSVEQPWLHSTLDFGRHRIWTRGEVTRWVSLPAIDFCQGEMVVNDIQRVPELPGEALPEGVSNLIERHQRFIDWRRQILFIKGPDYVLIRDDVDDNDDKLPTGWSVQFLADHVEVEGSRSRIGGQHGVDLEVLMAEPEKVSLTTSQWSHPGEPAPAWVSEHPMPAMAERQIALHANAPVDGDYLALMAPYRRGETAPGLSRLGAGVLRVEHGGGDDVLFFGASRGLMSAADITFAGRVGLMRRLGRTVEISIIEGVSMRVPEMIVQFPGPVTLRIDQGHISGMCDGLARSCFLHWADPPPAPARLTIDGRQAYVYSTFDGYVSFSVPPGRHVFEVAYDMSRSN